MKPILLNAAVDLSTWLRVGGILVVAILTLLAVLVILKYGRLWLQAYMSKADVSLASLIGMGFRRVDARTIVKAQVMAAQAGLKIAEGRGKTTARLESHYLSGGDVDSVMLAIIAAHRAGLDLSYERAAAIDLTGRDLLEAVRTSIFPKVINCPDAETTGNARLSAIAKNGVELLTQVRVTVRTNLDQLIGGATEQTIIARTGQGIVSTIGSMESHEEALAMPDRISRTVLEQGIQSNTAYSIVSIDVATIDVGRNIGARLQSEQAESDKRVARALAEMRRAEAIALEQEMKALVTEQRANRILADSEVPAGLADAFRSGQFKSRKKSDRDKALKPTGTEGPILKFPEPPEDSQ